VFIRVERMADEGAVGSCFLYKANQGCFMTLQKAIC
jgi:hypothetical protein